MRPLLNRCSSLNIGASIFLKVSDESWHIPLCFQKNELFCLSRKKCLDLLIIYLSKISLAEWEFFFMLSLWDYTINSILEICQFFWIYLEDIYPSFAMSLKKVKNSDPWPHSTQKTGPWSNHNLAPQKGWLKAIRSYFWTFYWIYGFFR